ncbi:MAG: acetolactate synthase [Variovorax paradoxus]|uniref:Acetolactate synthase n=1 Tax=Variovorax paradoxus TaxID=34073 RepID=A0A2W5Q955_VARPD|nr:MAG: acetolactate synthase [Variovorax paradoxus]
MPMTGNDYLAQTFADCGITHFFHVPVIVPGALKAMQARGVTPVMTHGEKAAAYMADGFARASRRVGACGAQAIGATNLAAGLRDAYMARIPVLAITGGSTAENRYRHFYQQIDDMPIYDALTKFNARVESPARLPDLLRTALRAATTGMPQPVHLEIDQLAGAILAGEVGEPMAINPRYARFPADRPAASGTDVSAAVTALLASQRPIIVAGGGVRSSGAEAELLAFARYHRIPIATALNAKGAIVDSDPLAVGVVGEYSRDCANQAVSEADLVFFIGSLTGGLTTRGWAIPAMSTQVIHLDIHAENIGRNYPNTLPLCGDARTVLQQLIDAAPQAIDRRAWLDRVRSLRAQWLQTAAAWEQSDAMPMRPERLCAELSRSLPQNAILVGDTGHAAAWLARHIDVHSPLQTVIRAHGSLGWAFPASIGAKAACPDRPVVSFVGDGAFLYHLQELETAVRYGLNVICVVNNNQSLNQEQDLWVDSTDYDKNWRFEKVDFVKTAEAFGCLGLRVQHPTDFQPAMEQALAAGRPVVIEAITDKWVFSPGAWMPGGKAGAGSFYAPPSAN